MSKTTQTLAALALSALAMTATFAQGGGGGGQRGGGGGAAPGGGQGGGGARGPQQPMSFFITSVGKGDGTGHHLFDAVLHVLKRDNGLKVRNHVLVSFLACASGCR